MPRLQRRLSLPSVGKMFNQHYLQKAQAALEEAHNKQGEAAQKKRNDTRLPFKKVKANTTSQATQTEISDPTTTSPPGPRSTNANQVDHEYALQRAWHAGLQAGRESRYREGIANGFGMVQYQVDRIEEERDRAEEMRDRAAELLAEATGDLEEAYGEMTRLQHVNSLLAHTVHVVAAERDIAASERDALRVPVKENNE